MANKPFAIQGADLTLGGVNLQAGTTGVVIPGVTRATSYVPEEVEDVADQTHAFNSPPIVIDHTYRSILNGDYSPSGYTEAEYAVTELDGDDFIDGIEIVSEGSGWDLTSANGAKNNNMWAYVGSEQNPFASFVNTDWIQIPFRVKIRAGEVETIGGGGSVSGLQGNTDYSPEEEGDVRYTLGINEDIALTIYQGDTGGPTALGPGISLGASIGAAHQRGVVAIGNDDVGYNSAPGGVYIGAQAGWFGDEGRPGPQGENAIAIGVAAAYAFAYDNSITLNATGNELNPTGAGLFIKPIQEGANATTLNYNTTTGEVTYSQGGGLAPQLTVSGGNLVASTNLAFEGTPGGFIAVVDSSTGDQTAQWFNAVTGDDLGNMYAVGTSDYGYQYVWAFNADSTVKWKVGIDDITGSDAYPFTVHWKNGFLTVGVKYYNGDYGSDDVAVIELSDSDGSVTDNSILSAELQSSNKYLYDSDVLADGSPVIVGQLEGEYSTVTATPRRESWASKQNILVVDNSNFSTIPAPWSNNGFQVQRDANDNNSWDNVTSLNWFKDVPVYTVTGSGGPQTYTEAIDYVDGHLRFQQGSGGPSYIELDTDWINGTGQNFLLSQGGAYTFDITIFGARVLFQMFGNWTNPTPGVSRAEGTVTQTLNGAFDAGTVYNVTLFTILQNRATTQLRYVPAGLTNGSATGGMIDSVDFLYYGNGYENNDVVKVRGSDIGGVDTITLTGTSNLNTANNSLYFLVEDYPGFSVVENGWRASGPGIDGWATLSNVQNAGGTLWRFDVPDGISLQAGETYTIDNNGNDVTITIFKYYGSLYPANYSGHVTDAQASTSRMEINSGVDYRGVENTSTYTAGTDYVSGTISVVFDTLSGNWLLGVDATNTAIIALLQNGDTLTDVGGVGNTINITSGPTIVGDNYAYVINDTSAFLGSGSSVPNFTTGNGTYPTTTWNIRSSLDGQAFIWTPNWQHTFGGGNYEYFTSVAYDDSDTSIFALGYFNDANGNTALFKFDQNGDKLWSKHIEDASQIGGDPGTVAVDNNGSVFVSAVNDNGWTVVTKLNSSDGTIVWQSVQQNSDNWDNFPQIGVDSNGDVIVAGAYYNQNDPQNTHYVWSVQKLHGADGNLAWARFFDDAEQYDMYEMYDNDCQVLSVVDTSIYFGGYVYDENDQWYQAIAVKLPTDGTGTGTYGRWIYSEDQDAQWSLNTGNVSITNLIITATDTLTLVNTGYSASTSNDAVGGVTASGFPVGGGGHITGVKGIVFDDGTTLETGGLSRHSTTQGGNSMTLDATMNGKFLHYNGNQGNSWIYVPGNTDVPLPIGFIVTIILDDYSGNQVYINNATGNSYDANINAVGFGANISNYWYIGGNGNTGVYTLLKVDTNRWVLSGPEITNDN